MYCARNPFRRRICISLACALAALIASLGLSGCGLLPSATQVAETAAVKPATNGAEKSSESSATTDTVGTAEPVEATVAEIVPQPIAWGEATDKVASGARLLCVDGADDYALEHVAGATSVPTGKIDVESQGWAKDSPLVLTSSTEPVSRSTAGHLVRNGFTDVSYLHGGYDEWGGTFEGTGARKATVPAKVYYIYTTSEDVLVVGDLSRDQVLAISKELVASMNSVAKEFDGDVDVEVLNTATDASRVVDLVNTYDVPLHTYSGIQLLLTPRWILVDKDGRVTHMDSLTLNTSTSHLYGWCCEQSEAE